MNANIFEQSLTLESFASQYWIDPAKAAHTATWTESSDAEQARGMDFHVALGSRSVSLELKTEALPDNFFVEMFQVVESRRSFELGYAYKCEADFLVLGNLPGMFAVVVPRAAFLAHAMNIALLMRGNRTLSLVVNAAKDKVSRCAIGLPVAYAAALASFAQPWALVDFSSPECYLASQDYLAKSLLEVHPNVASQDDKDAAGKRAEARMAAALRTVNSVRCLQSQHFETDSLEDAVRRLADMVPNLKAPAIAHRLRDALLWVNKGLITSQPAFADRFTQVYGTADGDVVKLEVRPVGPRKSSYKHHAVAAAAAADSR